jgi:hypothetical protein
LRRELLGLLFFLRVSAGRFVVGLDVDLRTKGIKKGGGGLANLRAMRIRYFKK